MDPESRKVLSAYRLTRQLRSARATWADHLRHCVACRAATRSRTGRCADGRQLVAALQEAQRVFDQHFPTSR